MKRFHWPWIRREQTPDCVEEESGVLIVQGDEVICTPKAGTFRWTGPYNADCELRFKRAFVLDRKNWNVGISECVYRVRNREFKDLSFAKGTTLRTFPDGSQLRVHEDGTKFLFEGSSSPTFDLEDRLWSGVSKTVAYQDGGGVHLIHCMHGYQIPRIFIFLELEKSIPSFDEWMKQLDEG